jgi:diguanylate cyclase (GGDEF)-like protein
LKRLPVGYVELLRDLLPRRILDPEMIEAIARVLAGGSASEIRETAQRIVRTLIESGDLEVLERVPDGMGYRLRLREPTSRLRFAIRTDEPAATESLDVIPLPLEPNPVASLKASLVRQLLADQGALVRSDRVAGPREIIQRLEQILRDSLEVDTVTFLSIDHPPGEFWGSVQPSQMAMPETRLRELARSRSYLLCVRDFSRLDPRFGALPRSGSALFLGIGDDTSGWRAVIEARDAREGHFTPERIGLAVLLGQHFQALLASAVRLQSLIFLDFLTSLYNRPYFEDQLEKQVAIAQRRKQSLALCIVDIDGFKNFNTLYGYEGGDRVLVTVGCILKGALRTSDTLARYGGEEFAALLVPPVTREKARAIAERLRSAVETEPFQVQSLNGTYLPERITVSVGGALFPDHATTAHDLWTAANRMLIEAKQMGKNRVRFVGDEIAGERHLSL